MDAQKENQVEQVLEAKLIRMRLLSQWAPGDDEHEQADRILCDVLREFARGTPLAARVETLIETFDDMDKWYS